MSAPPQKNPQIDYELLKYLCTGSVIVQNPDKSHSELKGTDAIKHTLMTTAAHPAATVLRAGMVDKTLSGLEMLSTLGKIYFDNGRKFNFLKGIKTECFELLLGYCEDQLRANIGDWSTKRYKEGAGAISVKGIDALMAAKEMYSSVLCYIHATNLHLTNGYRPYIPVMQRDIKLIDAAIMVELCRKFVNADSKAGRTNGNCQSEPVHLETNLGIIYSYLMKEQPDRFACTQGRAGRKEYN